MNAKKSPGPQPRHTNKMCFCAGLAQLLAAVPAQAKAVIQSAINAFLQSPGAVDDDRGAWFYALAAEFMAVIETFPQLCGQFVKALASPVVSDCEPKVYAAVAYAAAQRIPSRHLATVVNALRKNLAMCSCTCDALCILARRSPEAVLGLLHDGLCADSTIAVKTRDVLRIINPRVSVIQEWLDSSVPGLRAAMLFYLAESYKLRKRFKAAMEKAMGDPDPNCRAVAVEAVFRVNTVTYLVEAAYRPFILAAFDDPDPCVRSAAGKGLVDTWIWTEMLLPELSGLLLNHGDDDLRVLVARAIGQLKRDGSRATTALMTVAKEGNTKAGEEARRALALVNPRKARVA